MKKTKPEKTHVFDCSICGEPFEVKTDLVVDPETTLDICCKNCSKTVFEPIANELEFLEGEARRNGFFYCFDCKIRVNEIIDDNYLYCQTCAERELDQLEREEDEKNSLR